ncbi:MAG: MFS transporter [Deltaproteobacteria bacterium]|nr:MFS transporter [Deltaproteobacteria bacterium]
MRLHKLNIFYGWWIVLASSVICGLGYGTWMYSFGVFFKPMMAEFGWTRAMTAGAYSLRSIQGGIAAPILGWVIDKYGGRVVIFGGAIVSGLGCVLMYFVDSLWSFYLINGIILSIGMGAMLYLSTFTIITKWFTRRLSLALSLMSVGAGLGGLICAPASAVLINRFGWRLAFVITGVVIWTVVLPLILVIRNSPEEKGLLPDGDEPGPVEQNLHESHISREGTDAPVDFTLRQALVSRAFWLLVGSFFFQGLAQSVVIVHAVPALTDAGLPLAFAAFSIGLLLAVSIIGRLLFGYLGDLMDKRTLLMVCYALVSAGTLVLMGAGTMPMTYLFIALFGIGYGGVIPLDPAIRADYFGRTAFAVIQGFMSPLLMVSYAVGPILAGHLFDISGSYRISFLVSALVAFASVGCAFFLPRTHPAHR